MYFFDIGDGFGCFGRHGSLASKYEVQPLSDCRNQFTVSDSWDCLRRVDLVSRVNVWASGFRGGIILGHVALLVAIPLVTTQLGLSQVDSEHVDAATLMGLSEREMLFGLVLPIVRPYVITGGLFALIISMNEYVVAFLLSGFSVETLPIKIYNSQRYGFEPTLSVGTIIYISFSLVVLSYIATTGKL